MGVTTIGPGATALFSLYSTWTLDERRLDNYGLVTVDTGGH